MTSFYIIIIVINYYYYITILLDWVFFHKYKYADFELNLFLYIKRKYFSN